MYAPSKRRGHHRKRLSALRLSSDSTVTTLPLYTSPPRHRLSELSDIPSEQPPAYSDSAEEADEDTDSTNSDSEVVYVPSPPPSLPVSPRRPRRPQARSHSSSRRQNSVANANDPYLDSLLARSIHALEMSNTLLQSSMSTQTSLSAVLADDAIADRHLEERTRKLTSRIRSNRDMHEAWMDDLEEISRGVEGLVRGEDTSDDDNLASTSQRDAPISQSLPTSSLEQRMGAQSRSRRQASQDFRQHHASGSSSNLQLSVHDRSHFIAPAPRAITMYIDSSEAADLISLPSTLGVRSDTRPPPTPLPNQTAHTPATPELDRIPASAPIEQHHRRAADMLASYVMPRPSSSISSSPPFSRLRRRSSSSSAATVKRSRVSKSPPPPIRIEASSSPSSSVALRSRSNTPCRESPVQRQLRSLTPPIEELSTSSASSESATLHVDRTVESLRQILEKQRTASQSSGKPASAKSVPTISRPSLLSPPVAPPTSGTSTATASVSRLFTNPRYTTSTRAPSPPKQSSLKKASQPSTPVTPSPSPSLLSVPDLLGLGGRTRSSGSSGASTPKRISFAEPPESYSSTKPEGSSSKFRAAHKTRSKPNSGGARGRDAKGKGKAKAKDDESDGENLKVGWWASWLLGAAGPDSGSALTAPGAGRSRSEERYASFASPRAAAAGGTWSMRPGFGSSIEEWGA